MVKAGIRHSILLSTALVVLQIGGLLMVIAAGAPHVGAHPLLEGSTASGVLGDAALAIFAVLYVAVGVTAVALVGAETLAISDWPLALVLAHDWGTGAANLISVVALGATTNTCLTLITAASRLLCSMAQVGALPSLLGQVGARTRAPQVATVTTLVGAVPLALLGHIGLVAAATGFLVYAIFIVVNAAVISLRYRQPGTPRPFQTARVRGVPLTPVLGLAAVPLMLPFLEASAWLIGCGIVAAGAAAWAALALGGRRAG